MINNSEEELIKKIEELNNEYLSSREYNLGKLTNYIIDLVKSKKIINVLRLYFLHLKNIKNQKEKPKDEKLENRVYVVNNEQPYKVVIYSCITGNYDKIEEPLIAEKQCDYILYTNNLNLKSNFWDIRAIPESIEKMENAKINRYIKMHPKELFPDYDYAIYIDGNIRIISIISQLIKKVNKTTGLAIHRHCERDCIYKEIKACRAYGKGNYRKLKEQINRYKLEGFPQRYGMLECNMLISDLKNHIATEIFDNWWNEYLISESMRDQIALPYVLWKSNISIKEIGNLGNNVNQNCLIKINTHK